MTFSSLVTFSFGFRPKHAITHFILISTIRFIGFACAIKQLYISLKTAHTNRNIISLVLSYFISVIIQVTFVTVEMFLLCGVLRLLF